MYIKRNQPCLGFGQATRWVLQVPYPSGNKVIGPFTSLLAAMNFGQAKLDSQVWHAVSLYPEAGE